MDLRDRHWADVKAALRTISASDVASPKARNIDDGDQVNKRFLRFHPNISARDFGDYETKLDYGVVLEYSHGALWVECLFRQPSDDSHSFDILKAHYDNTLSIQRDNVEWNGRMRHKRVILHLCEANAEGMSAAEVAKIAVDALKELEGMIRSLARVHRSE